MNFGFFKFFKSVPKSPAKLPSKTGTSRRGIVALVAAGIAGAVGLVRLAIHVTKPGQNAAEKQENSGAIIGSDVVSLWLHPALHELARHPPEDAVLESQEAFRSYAKRHGLESACYVITVRQRLADGRVEVTSTIRRPFEMPVGRFSEFPAVMATAAGRPPGYPFSKAKVGVIPDRFLKSDPREVLDDLRMLEQLPDPREAR